MPFSSSRRELTSLRLTAQRIASSDFASPADAVRGMLAMQAQDFPGARWSVGLRVPRSTEDDVRLALAAGEIARSWPLRGTLHLVAPEDLGWIMDLTRPRQATFAAKRRRDLEITDAELAKAGEVAVMELSGGNVLRRDSMLAAWEAAGISTAGQRAYHLLWNLGQQSLIVFGPSDDKHPTFALFDEAIRQSRALEGDEALAELASRYLRSHGPATERDLAWWASITLSDARRGIALATGLEQRVIDGVSYWMAEGLEPAASGVHALPGFDEYLLGYQDRSAPLAAEFSQRIVPGNNGMFLPTIVVDGEVVGTWKRRETAKSSRITPSEFTSLTKRAHAGFTSAITEYGRFVGRVVAIDD